MKRLTMALTAGWVGLAVTAGDVTAQRPRSSPAHPPARPVYHPPAPVHRPHPEQHHHPHHHPAVRYYTPPAEYRVAATQNVRYIRVSNQTGEPLRVYVRLPEDGQVRLWNFAEGQVAYLAVDNQRIVAGSAFIWAESDTRRWTRYQEESLAIVAAPYRSDAVGTHTHTFR